MPNNVNSNKLIETAIHVKYVENKIEIKFKDKKHWGESELGIVIKKKTNITYIKN